MSSSGRVPFTRENTAVLLDDHQGGLFTGVHDIDVNELKHNVVGLARAAQILTLPVVAVTTARDSKWWQTIGMTNGSSPTSPTTPRWTCPSPR
jgi:nicotinamidase-related amidase